MNDKEVAAEARYPLVVISDLHLGMKNAASDRLVDFLENLNCDTLVLNGDIIDGQRLNWRKPKTFSEDQMRVFDALNGVIARGTKVVYIPGNHDEKLRAMDVYGKSFMGITFAESHVHETPQGKKYFISHGDQFDDALKNTKEVPDRLVALADRLYVGAFYAASKLDRAAEKTLKVKFNLAAKVRHLSDNIVELGAAFAVAAKQGRLSPKAWLKNVAESVACAQRDFEDKMMKAVRDRRCAGGVSGHTHIPGLKKTEDGLIYANSGDWVHSFTALAVNKAGEFELLKHDRIVPKRDITPDRQYRPLSQAMAAAARNVWPGRGAAPRMSS